MDAESASLKTKPAVIPAPALVEGAGQDPDPAPGPEAGHDPGIDPGTDPDPGTSHAAAASPATIGRKASPP